MSISGLLSTMALPEILQWVKFGQKSGALVIERKGIVKKIYFESGLVTSASSNDPREYLGQVLIFFGTINEARLREAFELQSTSHKLLGKILVENFEIPEEDILRALRLKIEETIYDIFLWTEGKFIYSEDASASLHDRLEASITIDQLIFEGARRVDEYREFRQEFSSDDVVFKLKGERRDLGELESQWVIKKIYAAIDGEKSVRRILLETRTPEYHGVEAFGKLYWGKFLEPTKKSIERIAKAVEASVDILQKATNLFKEKKFGESYLLLENFLQDNPANEEAQTLTNLAREAYLGELRDQFPAMAVPKLNLDISALSEKVFNSKEGFLASRIDGRWDIKSLVMISPLGELESLKILKRLLDEGVINLKR